MKPTEILAHETTPDGEDLVLSRRDGVYLLSVGGMELMTSRAHGSEDALAALACAAIAGRPAPRVLLGGLGFGYTLRAALDRLPAKAEVWVCEVFPALVDWNRGVLAGLAGRPLADRRVRAIVADVRTLLDGAGRFDAILLDVDNGPEAFTLRSNGRLYTVDGLRRLAASLKPNGVLTVWSAAADPAFQGRLRRAGFDARTERAPARGGGKGRRDAIFVARRR